MAVGRASLGAGCPQTGMSHHGAAPRGLPGTRRSAGTSAPTGSRGQAGRVHGKILWRGTLWHSVVFCAAPSLPVASCQPRGIQHIGFIKEKKKAERALFETSQAQMLGFAVLCPVRTAASCGLSAGCWTVMYVVRAR